MIPNPHDALVKVVFGKPEHAQGMLRAVVPAAVAEPRVRANAVSILFDACYFAGHLDTALSYMLQALSDPDADVETRAADVLAVTEHIPGLNVTTGSSDHRPESCRERAGEARAASARGERAARAERRDPPAGRGRGGRGARRCWWSWPGAIAPFAGQRFMFALSLN